MMEGDAVAHALLTAGVGPLAQEVALGTDVHRVPGMVL